MSENTYVVVVTDNAGASIVKILQMSTQVRNELRARLERIEKGGGIEDHHIWNVTETDDFEDSMKEIVVFLGIEGLESLP